MHTRYSLLLILLFVADFLFAQQDILVTIDNKNYTIEDFLYVYNKNNDEPLSGDVHSIKEELNRFIDLKLKVLEAKQLGFDKSPDFIRKYEDFKKQLAYPFLIDEEKFAQLTNQAYQRIKNEVHVHYIFLKCSNEIPDEDTVEINEKLKSVRTRLLESEKFEYVAQGVSDDPTAAYNGGDLWYVHAFELPYEVENYLYKAEPGKLSEPIHSKEGFHLVRVEGYRKNPGMMKVAHILIEVPADADKEKVATAKKKAENVYRELLTGADFSEMVKQYSDDVGVESDGILPWFGTGDMDRDFEKACINLRKGEISRPVRTKYGWHIIKKIDVQPFPGYNFIVDQISNAVRNSDRFEICENNIVEKTKKRYGFEEKADLAVFYDMADSLIFEGKWKAPAMIMSHDLMFSIGNKEYNKQNFADFLAVNQRKMMPVDYKKYINAQYQKFKKQKILDFAFEKLSENNAEYQRIISEFRDGILLFDYLEKEVWGKAQTDTLVLINYYKQHESKYNKYSADISVFKFAPDINIKKMKKYFLKYKKQHIKDELLAKVISKSTKSNFQFTGEYQAEEGSNEVFDWIMNEYRQGNISPKQRLIILMDKNTVVYLNSEIKKTQKSWNYFKDEVISDYQKSIDEKTAKNLRNKHSVKINEAALKSLIY